MSRWIIHNGCGRPVPIGTLVEVQMFNGVRREIAAGTATHDLDGSPIPAWRSAGWSAWDFNDGGPLGPKFRAYRLVEVDKRMARDAALFRSWLVVREGELA